MPEIIPAILTDDLKTFAAQIKQASDFGARTVQIDFTDGKFVSSHTLMPDELDAFVLSEVPLTLEAHLMVDHPEQYFATLFALGFRRIAVHLTSLEHPRDTIRQLREYGFEGGIALNPDIALVHVEPLIRDLDFVLFMTVVPGEQGHAFAEQVLDKIHLEYLHSIREVHPHVTIETDGGVKADNILDVVMAGAERVVVGSGIWKADDPKLAYKELVNLANP